MAEKKDPEIAALEAVHSALKPLDPNQRQRVLASVFSLLEIVTQPGSLLVPTPEAESAHTPQPSRTTRPMALVELMQEISPGTNAQRIALFAYYRDKYEGKTRFSRDDLKAYFSKAKEQPPGNFDRDFANAARQGWIHEDGADSYITSKGIEAVESSFAGERSYTRSQRPKRQRARKPKGSPQKKKGSHRKKPGVRRKRKGSR